MPLPVSLAAVVDALDGIGEDWHTFLNVKTGELVTVCGADSDFTGEDEEGPTLEELEENPEFKVLPDRFEVDEYKMMERFSHGAENEKQREALLRAIHGKGAFHRFKDTLHRQGLEKEWYRYRDEAFERLAVDWLESLEVPYTKDTRKEG